MRKPRTFDLPEVGLIVLFVALAVWAAVPKPTWKIAQETLDLRAKYGPDYHSREFEEWIIRDHFQDRRGGVFLDVGANHYQSDSNTFYLERYLDWTGIAVEPLREFEAEYLKYRPRTRFRAFFASDVSNDHAKMYLLETNSLVTSADKSFTERHGSDSKEVEATTVTLDDLLDHEQVTKIDFLSMDIELWEPKALAGFDVQRFAPELVCIEAHREVRQWILEYFARNDYVLVGKYLHVDPLNLYFMPAGRAGVDQGR